MKFLTIFALGSVLLNASLLLSSHAAVPPNDKAKNCAKLLVKPATDNATIYPQASKELRDVLISSQENDQKIVEAAFYVSYDGVEKIPSRNEKIAFGSARVQQVAAVLKGLEAKGLVVKNVFEGLGMVLVEAPLRLLRETLSQEITNVREVAPFNSNQKIELPRPVNLPPVAQKTDRYILMFDSEQNFEQAKAKLQALGISVLDHFVRRSNGKVTVLVQTTAPLFEEASKLPGIEIAEKDQQSKLANSRPSMPKLKPPVAPTTEKPEKATYNIVVTSEYHARMNEVVDRLRAMGVKVTNVMEIIGAITVNFDPAKLNNVKAILGVAVVEPNREVHANSKGKISYSPLEVLTTLAMADRTANVTLSIIFKSKIDFDAFQEQLKIVESEIVDKIVLDDQAPYIATIKAKPDTLNNLLSQLAGSKPGEITVEIPPVRRLIAPVKPTLTGKEVAYNIAISAAKMAQIDVAVERLREAGIEVVNVLRTIGVITVKFDPARLAEVNAILRGIPTGR